MRRLYHHTGGWTPRYRIPILMVPRSFLAVAILQAVAAQVPANDQLDTPVAVARPEAEPTSSIVGGVEISPSYKYPFLVSCLLCSRSLSRKQYDVQPVLPCLVSHSEHLLPAGELAILVLAHVRRLPHRDLVGPDSGSLHLRAGLGLLRPSARPFQVDGRGQSAPLHGGCACAADHLPPAVQFDHQRRRHLLPSSPPGPFRPPHSRVHLHRIRTSTEPA
jgi:hypothetical protein